MSEDVKMKFFALPLFVRDPTVSAEDSYSQSARVKLYSHDASSQEDSDIFQFLELKAPSEMGAKSGGLHVHYTDGQAEARLAPSYGPTAFARAASFVLHDGCLDRLPGLRSLSSDRATAWPKDSIRCPTPESITSALFF
ncbi:hypothetical protein POX_h09756 [Penicillium oxalicum]|uniref:Uncharacterized protein n=1 Tax=Penicillium oxalicum (strain 114-2 / CGMCC 5302) TaxID=933388 RepID=S8B9K8_PENO1|nr:hypothetical protein POX_h09756 [Penicillium oxalicum]EPS31472.1 hypothetical protein PDE_06427 [Penicillium oxalicum 114-2]KAI2785991.1 hypothetical protein POX_h09756 [Penicillium oxalicum]